MHDDFGTGKVSLTKRLVVAFGVFGAIALVGLAVFYVFLPVEREAEEKSVSGKPIEIEKPFYSSIGKAPNVERSRAALRQVVSESKHTYAIEFLMTPSKVDAEQMVEKLQVRDIQAYYMPLQKEGQIFYRVRSRLYQSEEAAQRDLRNLNLARPTPGHIVRL